jgi:hypothetical protein
MWRVNEEMARRHEDMVIVVCCVQMEGENTETKSLEIVREVERRSREWWSEDRQTAL